MTALQRPFRSLFIVISGVLAGFSVFLLPFLLRDVFAGGLEARIPAYLYNNITMYTASGNQLSRTVSVAANPVRLNESRFLPAWTGYSGFFDAGERKWMPLCPIERGNWPPDWIPLFHYPEKRFTLRFRGGILPSMCLLAACMAVAVKNQPGFCLAGVPKEILLPVFFCRTDVYDNEAERPGNGYTALEGRPSGRVFANASGILPESHCFCQLNGRLLRWRMNREKRSAAQLLMSWSPEKGTASGLLQKGGGEHVLC